MKPKYIKLFGFYGIVTVLAATATLTYILLNAYFHGTGKILFDFNRYGEMIPEMILLTTGLLSFIIWLKLNGKLYYEAFELGYQKAKNDISDLKFLKQQIKRR